MLWKQPGTGAPGSGLGPPLSNLACRGKIPSRPKSDVSAPYSAATSKMSGSASMTVTPHGLHQNVRCSRRPWFAWVNRIRPPQLWHRGDSGFVSSMSMGRQIRSRLLLIGKAAQYPPG